MKKQVWYIYFTIYDGNKREALNVFFPTRDEANTYVVCLKEEYGDSLEKVAIKPGHVIITDKKDFEEVVDELLRG